MGFKLPKTLLPFRICCGLLRFGCIAVLILTVIYIVFASLGNYLDVSQEFTNEPTNFLGQWMAPRY